MRISINQPYFFPYTGYISLIKHSDRFILFDIVQFKRHGWIERNRILKQNEGWLYIKVPLIRKDGRDTLIKDCIIDHNKTWKNTILSQLQVYKKTAPFYKDVMELIESIFATDHTDIVSLNKASLEATMDYLGFPKELEIYSEMNLDIAPPEAPDEWALNICKALGNDTHYVNPIGGVEFFNREKYEARGVKMSFHKQELTPYSQGREPFEPGLSIIDTMMFNSIEETNRLLDQFTLV